MALLSLVSFLSSSPPPRRRFWCVSRAAVADVWLGQCQRRGGDPVRVFPVAHCTLRPAPQLLRYGAADCQHLPGWILNTPFISIDPSSQQTVYLCRPVFPNLGAGTPPGAGLISIYGGGRLLTEQYIYLMVCFVFHHLKSLKDLTDSTAQCLLPRVSYY